MVFDEQYSIDWVKLRISQLQKVRAIAQEDIRIRQEEIEQYDYEISLLNGMLGVETNI
jgi:hypothetical protein